LKVLIAGGGTAGHINPGIAIAKYIKQKLPESEILFAGTEKGLENNLVPREGFELKLIRVKGFKRKVSLDSILSVKELFNGLIDAKRLLKAFKPDIVIGTGGYVCGPVLFMASRMKIPTLVHEQNAFPGVTNRILSRFVNTVAISFKEAKEYFKHSRNIVFTGNPIRNELLDIEKSVARQKLEIEGDSNLVVIFGGSRGAKKVNDNVVDMIKTYFDSSFKVIFATGEAQYGEVLEQLGEGLIKNIKVVPYIYNMSEVLSAADLVVSRAGAITVSELAALGMPSILIPSPYVTANHQEFNARALEVQGGSVIVLEKNLSSELLFNQIKSLLGDKEQLAKMARSAKKIAVTNASERIFCIIQSLTH
jgi:UDP-N-acetylglucosamine--N-acetylmuramyl-(pentapeptide) pyrophosphoryl-undecaprenol N-acetylglucosamine transferase